MNANHDGRRFGLVSAFFRRPALLVGLLLAALTLGRASRLQGWLFPVRITGGSMAEGWLGEHCTVRCTDCQFPCRYDAATIESVDRVVCPNCGFVNRDLTAAAWQRGERVLVDRAAGVLQRWQVVALRDPDAAGQLAVKRVVGLPGEAITIRNGDVFADGRMLRKSLPQLREVAVLVHDTAFEPQPASRLPPRWAGESATSGWVRRAGAFSWRPGGAAESADWLTYRHWRCVEGAGPRTAEYPVLDNDGYNQDNPRRLHRITDLLLTCRAQVTPRDGRLFFRIHDGFDWNYLTLDFGARRVRLDRRGSLLSEASLPPAAYAREFLVELACCDQQVVTAVDGLVLMCVHHDTADAPFAPTPRPLGIRAEGLQVRLRRLQVGRDIFYLDPQNLGADWTRSQRLGPSECFLLGDNAPISRDSRHWPAPAPSPADILGRVIRFPD